MHDQITTLMPAFVLSDFLDTLPMLPLACAFVTVAGITAWRVLERRERAYHAERERDRLRTAALERARLEAVARISAAHRGKGAA